MNVSPRSQMAAGIAMLGAAAVAVTPVTQPNLLPSPHSVAAAVELSALANPVSAIIETVQGINFFALSQEFVPDDLIWPEDFYGVEFLYAPLNIGFIPDIVNQFSTGVLSGLVNNLSGYAFAGISAPLFVGSGVAEAVFNTPGALVTAVGELIGGDPEAALATLVAQIVDPLQGGLEVALSSIGYIVDNVIENIQTIVTSTLPFVASGVINAVVGGLTHLVESAVTTVGTVIADLGSGQFEAAWNAAVLGFLGANGILGDVVRLSLGVGIVEDVEGTETVTVPSLRSVLTSELQRLGGQKFFEDGGITNDPFDPFAPPPAAVVAEVAGPAAAAAPAPAEAPADVAAAAAVEVVETAEVADIAEAAETTAAVEVAEAVEVVEAADAAEAVEITAAVEAVEAADATEAVEITAAVEAAEVAAAPSVAVGSSGAKANASDRAGIGTPKRSAPRAANKPASSGRLAG